MADNGSHVGDAEPLAPGSQRKRSWRSRFLDVYQRTGLLYLSLKAVGVSKERFDRECTRSPQFAQAVEVRRQQYADGLEEQFERMFKHERRPNVIAGIVLAKKHRPQDFVERYQGVTVTAQALVTPEQAHELLRTMLNESTPETRARLALPAADVETSER